MIIKVQQSLQTNDGKKRLLMYNKSRDYEYEEEVDENDPLLQALGNEPKLYFHAVPRKVGVLKHIKNSKGKPKTEYHLDIMDVAPWQDW